MLSLHKLKLSPTVNVRTTVEEITLRARSFLHKMVPIETGKWENVNFEEALDIAGYGKFSMFIIFLTGMTVCSSILASMDIGFLLPAAECDLSLTSSDKGLLGSAYFLGIILFSHMSGFLADTMGRRYVLLRGLALNFFTYIFGAFAPNFWSFFLIKFLSGVVTCPCMIAAFPFLGEYVPAKQRSSALLITTSLASLSFLYSSGLGWLVLQQTWEIDLYFLTFKPWRLFFLLCGLPSLFCAVLFYLTPESPKFLLTRGKKLDSVKVLQRVASVNSGRFQPEEFVVRSVKMDADETVPPIREKGVAGMVKNIVDQTIPLFKPPYLKNMMICIFIYFGAFYCNNSIFLWMPEVTNRISSFSDTHEGQYYLCEMVQVQSHNETVDTNTSTIAECDATINTAVFLPNLIIAVFQPCAMLLTSQIVPYVDRRLIITMVFLICSIMSFVLLIIPNATAVITLFGGIPVFVGIIFNVQSSIIIELFPTYIRAMAVSITMICGRFGSIIGSQIFSQLIDSHCSLLFKIISGFLLCGAPIPFCIKLKSEAEKKSLKQKIATTKNNTASTAA